MKITPIKTEQRVLIIALEHPEEEVWKYILAKTRQDDFGTEEGREIRDRMAVLLRHGKDFGGVAAFLEDPTLSEGAQDFLRVTKRYLEKARRIPLEKVKRLVSMLHDYRKVRSLYEGAQRITELCTEDKIQETTFADAEEALLATVKSIREDRSKKVTHIGMRSEKEAKAWYKKQTKKNKDDFISTGLPALDQHLGGFQRGDLVVVSAPRGGGKTALALQMALNQFNAGYRVGIVSLEMSEEQLYDRVVANVTETDFWRTRRREFNRGQRQKMWELWKAYEFNAVSKTRRGKDGKKKRKPVFTAWDIKDPNYLPENIELDLGSFAYDVIIIDYISLLGTGGRKELWMAQKEHSRYLKQLAGRLSPRCVMVVLTQLSKEERTKYGTGPEEDADYWLWWRYGEEEIASGQVDLRLGKARHARGGVIPAQFNLSQMRIVTTGAVNTAMGSYTENQKARGRKDVKHLPAAGWNQVEEALDVNLEDVRDKPPKRKKKRRKKQQPKRKVAATSTKDEVEAELSDWDV